jgi:glucosamine--fructose-6-phosphate aminotransferase (isomerizing)
MKRLITILAKLFEHLRPYLFARIYFGRDISRLPGGALVFFPLQPNLLGCGIAGIVTFIKKSSEKIPVDNAEIPVDISEIPVDISEIPLDISEIESMLQCIEGHNCSACDVDDDRVVVEQYLGGSSVIDRLRDAVQAIKNNDSFFSLFSDLGRQHQLDQVSNRLNRIIESEVVQLSENMGRLDTGRVDVMSDRIERLKDIAWSLGTEILGNVAKVKGLISGEDSAPDAHTVSLVKKINAVLNSIDRLEVRGRDSAGISVLMVFDADIYEDISARLQKDNLRDQLKLRCRQETLVNRGISVHTVVNPQKKDRVAVSITYKVADEIGSLGDNISYLRRQIAGDKILQALIRGNTIFDTVSAHTRWASVGAITEPNCHPVDNKTADDAHGDRAVTDGGRAIIHTCLNGDIDNFQELKQELEASGTIIPRDVTTDTKIIPLQIERYVVQGYGVEEAFRLAVNDFDGSHAISMHTDLAPGRIFLAQKGSGQAIFVGLADEHYMPTSEVYGFVEETSRYLKLDGETVVEGRQGQTQGQIFILDQATAGGLDGITAMYYDSTPLQLNQADIKHTEINSRDIDRQGFPHYFLKEISESPVSVEKTLLNRWKIKDGDSPQHVIVLDDTIIPLALQKALKNDQIKRIFFIGQGTAGVAALACANILDYYLDNPTPQISALKASEFSGFQLNETDDSTSMADALVIAISQSGTTTDTNRSVDMVKERGAYTLAIVNRRDSDITFKVDGVMYTSSGRDIEMSVASTKAFYSQIVAGAIVGLYIARLKQRINDEFVSREIKDLLALPDHMRRVLALNEQIADSAKTHAVTKTYWAAVGSGPNKASADEIRIKLSELCYKTISSDFVEDKKHIDLSSEPLIIVCAAGTRNTVIGDIIKDTAIFKAHKATPIVIANQGEKRFDPYAETVFQVPAIKEHLAPILPTLVGHIWGYYAALAINDGSRFLYEIRENVHTTINDYSSQGLDIYEIILEKTFQEKIAQYYNQFRQQKAEKRFPSIIGFDAASDLTLLLKYLSGRLPVC